MSSVTESQTTETTTVTNYKLPTAKTLQQCAKLAIVEDKPLMFDYYAGSIDKEVLIGVRENNEKLLVRNEEEYTSPISKIYKSDDEYIILTENSIYLVSAYIPSRRIS
tara:strand:+ start:862 stop:1185 length:324 start_codon:yes stop_codon:yes gene_type:complete